MLYTAAFAAYALYSPPVLPYTAAFVSLLAVTVLAVLVAVRGDSQSTAVLAVLGGFLTPILLRREGAGGNELRSLVQLFSYVTVLDLGLLAVSLYKRWRPLQVFCFVASWVLLWGWLDQTDSQPVRYYTLYPAAVLFTIFLLVPVVRNLRLKSPTHPAELGLILANPSCFFPTFAALVALYYHEYLGLAAAALAAVYLLLGAIDP